MRSAAPVAMFALKHAGIPGRFSIKLGASPAMADKSVQLASMLRTLTSELRVLEHDLKSGTISDVVALQDFRQAVDDIRMTSWTAAELYNAQPGRKELLASFLAAERIRRFAQMIRDLSTDLEQQDATWETGGIQTLFDSVTALQSRLDTLVREHRATFRNLKDDQG
jgi:hypothetical protein